MRIPRIRCLPIVVILGAVAIGASRLSVASQAPFLPSQVAPEIVSDGDALYGLALSGGNACIGDILVPPAPSSVPWEAGCGALLRYDPSGKPSIAHLFVPQEGGHPYALRLNPGGLLLGVTVAGGQHGRGTSFRFDPVTSRLTTLQSLGDAGPLWSSGDFAAAFGDGTVLGENRPEARFFILQSGKPARTIYTSPFRGGSGPFVVGADGRAIFFEKDPDDCDVALRSLGLDGTVRTLVPGDRTGTPACDGPVLADPVRPVLAFDGSIVANDAHHIFIYRPGQSPTVAFDAAAGKNLDLVPGSALPKESNEVFVIGKQGSCGTVLRVENKTAAPAAGEQAADACIYSADGPVLQTFAIRENGDTFGILRDATSGASTAVTIQAGKVAKTALYYDGTALDEAALPSGLEFSVAGAAGAIAATWSARGSLALPDVRLDPRKLDVKMRNLDVPGSSAVRILPVSSKPVKSQRVDMTMEKYVALSVPIAMPALSSGRYEFVVRARTALTDVHGARVPVNNDGSATYLYVSPFGRFANSPDAELHGLVARYAARNGIVLSTLPIRCNSPGVAMPIGYTAHIASIVRQHETLTLTGYGPWGLKLVGPGDAHHAYGTFYALSPLLVTFGALDGKCDGATAAFSSASDMQRYLRPAGPGR